MKVAPVTVEPVKTAPAEKKPTTDGGASPTAPPADPPAAAAPTGGSERHANPTVAVRGTSVRHDSTSTPASKPARRAARDTAESADARSAAPPARRDHAARSTPSTAAARADRGAAPAVRVLDQRKPAAALPVADAIHPHESDKRPIVDALGRAFAPAPLLIALGLGAALCVASRRLWRAG